ncbi:MAG: L-aspartate oxidase [Nostocoides sp.]
MTASSAPLVPVIVGSGLAGLTVARALAPNRCILVTPEKITQGAASMFAQGGISAALAKDDSPSLHAQDTLKAGAYAGDRRTITRITDAAPDVVRRLSNLGVPFDVEPDGDFDLALEGGHSRHRVAHAGDHSGATITATVAANVALLESVELWEGYLADRLVLTERGHVAGLVVMDEAGRESTITTDRVVLATGGVGGLFPQTTNPLTALGKGVAIAARAGARIDDMHLVQFHPTGLDVGRDPMPLLTEALRGAGAVLLADGKRFVEELQPRDVVSAAVWEQLQADRKVYLDARGVHDVLQRFPSVAALCAESGLDLANDLLPVRPTLHYFMGGITADARARTSVPGLYAVGETSRTGLHGANRLASNSLLEAVVTGEAAAADLVSVDVAHWRADVPHADPATRRSLGTSINAPRMPLGQVRAILGQSCGVLRDAPTLLAALAQLEPHTGEDAAYVGWLIAHSALTHPHSVGAHRRTDDPSRTLLEAPA